MANLTANIMGIKLKNPIIAGASNLSANTDNLRKMEESGVGAIVYKSLFEEQIQIEAYQMEQELTRYNERGAEMQTLFPRMEHSGAKQHLLKISQARKALNIPLIASLNATSENTWVEYSSQLADTGADALELNFYSTPGDFDKSGARIEDEILSALSVIHSKVSIPISVKLSPYFTNTLHLIRQMDALGIKGFVLFNRLFEPDIDIHKEEQTFPWNLSREGDIRLSLRYAGLLYGNIQGSIISNSGVLNGYDAIQALLAGADAVQIVSSLFYNGIDYITQILADIEVWMEEKGYLSLSDFQGSLSRKNSSDPFAYSRSQYVDILFQKSDQIFEKHPLP